MEGVLDVLRLVGTQRVLHLTVPPDVFIHCMHLHSKILLLFNIIAVCCFNPSTMFQLGILYEVETKGYQSYGNFVFPIRHGTQLRISGNFDKSDSLRQIGKSLSEILV